MSSQPEHLKTRCFQKGNSAARTRKPRIPLRCRFEQFLEMTPEEFYGVIGVKSIPAQFALTRTMYDAIIAVIMGVALGHVKGDKLKAAAMIFDRMEGKPVQTMRLERDITDEQLEKLSDEDLRKLAEME